MMVSILLLCIPSFHPVKEDLLYHHTRFLKPCIKAVCFICSIMHVDQLWALATKRPRLHRRTVPVNTDPVGRGVGEAITGISAIISRRLTLDEMFWS